MSKNKVERIVSAVLFVFYLIFIAIYFSSQVSYAKERYEDYEDRIQFETRRVISLCESNSVSSESFLQYVESMLDFQTSFDYFSVFKMYAVYNADSGEVVSTNGFMVEVEDGNYLYSNSDSDRAKVKTELKEKFESEDDVKVKNAEFYVLDGKRIYTSLMLENTKTGEMYSLKLSDPKGEVQKVDLMNKTQLELDTVVPEEMEYYSNENVYYYFIDGDAANKQFIYINLHLDAVFVGKDLAEASDFYDRFILNEIDTATTHIGVYKDNYTHTETDIRLADGNYALTYATYFNPYRHAISFSANFLWFNILFLILTLVLRIAVPYVYEKNKLYEQTRSAFTAAAAHELKTPIAVIANSAECIMENVSPEKNEKYVKSIYDESLRMGRLVNSLMQYNRISTGKTVKIRKCDLSEIALAEVEKYKTAADEKGIDIQTDICQKAKVKADSELIALVIDNYLSNAVKHTESGKTVKVSLYFRDIYDSFRLSVFNEGEQIPKEHIDKIWNVLYRADEVRNSLDNSSGMGLAISSQILEIHKCTYGAINRDNGVEFDFDLK